MSSSMSARFLMRNATSVLHGRVDLLFSNADLAVPHHYVSFLAAQAAAHLPVEQALDDGGVAAIIGDWPERKRGDLIREDIAVLGEPLPALEEAPRLVGTPALLGAAYVLEGSRLGGKILAKSVGTGLPRTYLTAEQPAAWRRFVLLLDELLVSSSDVDEAIGAACDVFGIFERSGRRLLPGGHQECFG